MLLFITDTQVFTGFVIAGRRIITNAHVVADHTFVLVRKHGSPNKYRAQVQAIGHECDLAILVVENDEFWEGMTSLELGDIPFLQEAVAVVGYPQGLEFYIKDEMHFFFFTFYLVHPTQQYKSANGVIKVDHRLLKR